MTVSCLYNRIPEPGNLKEKKWEGWEGDLSLWESKIEESESDKSLLLTLLNISCDKRKREGPSSPVYVEPTNQWWHRCIREGRLPAISIIPCLPCDHPLNTALNFQHVTLVGQDVAIAKASNC